MQQRAQELSFDGIEHSLLYANCFCYCAHPHMVKASPGNWLLVFTQSVRRDIVLHPPQDPLYCNMLMRSHDEGRSWSEPTIVPSYSWRGVECAGLTALKFGRILLNQWRFEWHTLAHAQANLRREDYRRPEELMGRDAMAAELADWTPDQASIADRYPWARGSGETWVHRSEDGGATFAKSSRIETSPYSGGYGMRGGLEFMDGEIILPLCDVPRYRNVFVVRSRDGGETWSPPQHVAGGDGHAFEEPAPLLLRSGAIVMLLRDNTTRDLHCVRSSDGGRSWTAPQATGIADYPAHVLELPDGAIACAAGRRRVPFGISLHMSYDGGETWNACQSITVSPGLHNRDLGYPTMALRQDGGLFVVYYAQGSDGVTGLHASIVGPELTGALNRKATHGGR